MKKIFLFHILILQLLKINAQSDGLSVVQTPTLGQQISKLFAPLDLTEVCTNVLMDKGINFLNWKKLNGSFPTDSSICRADLWGMLNFQAVSSFIGNYNPFPPSSYYMEYMKQQTNKGQVYLGFMALDYHRVRQDAITSNLISFDASDSTLHDVMGRTESPYIRDTMMCLAALRSKTEGLDIDYVLPEQIVMSNLGLPDSLWIDFDDGTDYTLIDTNDIYTIHYTDFEVHVLTVKAKWSNGELFYAKTEIENIPETSGLINGMPSGYNNIPDDSFVLNRDTISIFYGSPCKKLLKPLIFIEGINIAKLNPNDYKEMIIRLTFEKDGKVQKVAIPDGKSVWDDFAKMGYDIIYYNFELGDGDLIENSNRVAKFIDWVNKEKKKNKSIHQNVVIGASMGGVVGYRALRTMEINGPAHDARILITFDSPLKGANVPLGLQSFVKFLGNLEDFNPVSSKKIKGHVPELELFEEILLSGAAKQMLYYNIYNCDTLEIDSDNDGVIDEYKEYNCGKSSWHDDFYDDLDAMGSLEMEHIPISNGSSIGELQELIPSELFLELTAKSQEHDLLGVVNVNKCKIYIMPSLGTQVIYEHDVESWFYFILQFYYRQQLTVKVDASKKVNYDVAPGGMTDFGLSQSLNKIALGKTSINLAASQPAWGFVPTVSGLKMPKGTDPYISISDCGSGLVQRCYSSKDNSAKCIYSGGTYQQSRSCIL